VIDNLELFSLPKAPASADAPVELGKHDFYPTRHWLAQVIVESRFADLTTRDHVGDFGCGDGVFLDALPKGVRATGIELNPALAEKARAKGHDVIVGDFCTVDLPPTLTAAIGNPPFNAELIDTLLARLAQRFEPGGRAGFVLPAYYFQTSHHVHKLRASWSIAVDLIPRDVFPGLSMPLTFSIFTRSLERRLFGLAFYDQVRDVLTMHAHVRNTLNTNPMTWKAVVREALDRRGGVATLTQLYDDIEPKRPSGNPWWRYQVRKVVNMVATRVERGVYQLVA
jgi:site-specific DNA-methyltransferase (adenine-specific)